VTGVLVVEAVVEYKTELSIGGAKIRVERGDDVAPVRSTRSSFGGLVGSSSVMRELYALLERLAPTHLSVLLEGPTGTGKDIAARALHEASRRGKGPFVVVDCTTIPPSLAESILFGHEKGAFTGATEKRIGLLEAATTGTVFFDELGDLPRELQPKLLGALERREITPVGGTKPRAIDVRVLSATLRDLRAMVNRGEFREDLYYRVAQARVAMPPLADRPDDVRALAQHFIAALPWDVAAARAITPEALDVIAQRSFLGNVRDLKSTIERVAMIAAGPSITEADLAFERLLVAHDRDNRGPETTPASTPPPAPRSGSGSVPPEGAIEPFKDAKRTAIDEFERGYLERLLEKTGLNISRAAGVAGVERQTLRELLRKHGLHSIDR
jgi:DNA-binding NtrC family response regulator